MPTLRVETLSFPGQRFELFTFSDDHPAILNVEYPPPPRIKVDPRSIIEKGLDEASHIFKTGLAAMRGQSLPEREQPRFEEFTVPSFSHLHKFDLLLWGQSEALDFLKARADLLFGESIQLHASEYKFGIEIWNKLRKLNMEGCYISDYITKEPNSEYYRIPLSVDWWLDPDHLLPTPETQKFLMTRSPPPDDRQA